MVRVLHFRWHPLKEAWTLLDQLRGRRALRDRDHSQGKFHDQERWSHLPETEPGSAGTCGVVFIWGGKHFSSFSCTLYRAAALPVLTVSPVMMYCTVFSCRFLVCTLYIVRHGTLALRTQPYLPAVLRFPACCSSPRQRVGLLDFQQLLRNMLLRS